MRVQYIFAVPYHIMISTIQCAMRTSVTKVILECSPDVALQVMGEHFYKNPDEVRATFIVDQYISLSYNDWHNRACYADVRHKSYP
jgi:predicted dinucleotide-binding enzyme